MARGINKVILIGNLGNDPDVRYTSGGSPIANVSLATSDSWRDKETGDLQERTEWHRVVFFSIRRKSLPMRCRCWMAGAPPGNPPRRPLRRASRPAQALPCRRETQPAMVVNSLMTIYPSDCFSSVQAYSACRGSFVPRLIIFDRFQALWI